MTVAVRNGRVHTTPLKLDLDPSLRARLDDYVRRENARRLDAKLTRKGVMSRALTEYLDWREREERTS